MKEDLYQILYCSRNSISGTPAEIQAEVAAILRASQANNKAAGLTGGLMFNSVFFAQALEGPMDALERTFERILRDPRHTDLTVLQTISIPERSFPAWSMAFASVVAEQQEPLLAKTLHTAMGDPTASGQDILAMMRNLVIEEERWAMPVGCRGVTDYEGRLSQSAPCE